MGRQKPGVANPAFVTKRLAQRYAKRDGVVLDGVMWIDMEITVAFKLKLKTSACLAI